MILIQKISIFLFGGEINGIFYIIRKRKKRSENRLDYFITGIDNVEKGVLTNVSSLLA